MKKIIFSLLLLTVLPFALTAASTKETYYMQRALEAIQGGDKETAIQSLSKELDSNPTNGFAHAWVAVLCAQMDSYGYAFQYAQSALKYLPKQERGNRSQMCLLLSEIYTEAKDTVRALSYLDMAQKEDPQDAHTYSRLVRLNEKRGNKAEALRYAQMAVKNMPKHPRAQLFMVSALTENGRYDEALEYCDRAYQLAGNDVKEQSRAILARADVHRQAKQPSAALADLMRSTRMDITGLDEDLLKQLVDTIPAEVQDSLLAAHEKEPDQIFWNIYLYHLYYETNEFSKAVQMGFSILPKYAGNSNVHYNASILEFHIGDTELAERMLLKQLGVDSTSAGTYARLEELYAETGRYKEAFEMADKALSFNPSDNEKSTIYILRGRIHQLKHDYQAAIDDFMAAVIADPDDYQFWFRIAKLYGQMNDSTKRAEALEQGRKAFAAHGRELSAEAYVVLGDTAAAYEAAKKMIRKDKSAEQHYNAACIYAQIDRTEEALEHLRLAFEYGFRSFFHVAWDTDLDSLRAKPEFDQLVNEYKQRNELLKQQVRASIDTELNY